MTTIQWDKDKAQSLMSAEAVAGFAAKFPVMALKGKDDKPTGAYRFFGRVSFPHMFTPSKMEGSQGQPTYSATVLFTPGYDLSLLAEAVKTTRAERWPKGVPGHWRNPFRDQGEKAEKLSGYTPGVKFIAISANSVNSKTGTALKPPPIYNARKELITDESEIYAGVWGLFVGRPYNYEPAGNCGTKFSFDMFIKLFDDTPLASGGRASVNDALDGIDMGDVAVGQSSAAAATDYDALATDDLV